MPFTPETIKAAWARSGGAFECTKDGHGNIGHCNRQLLWTLRGGGLGAGWRACMKASWGTDGLANCEIRCAACEGPMIKPAE